MDLKSRDCSSGNLRQVLGWLQRLALGLNDMRLEYQERLPYGLPPRLRCLELVPAYRSPNHFVWGHFFEQALAQLTGLRSLVFHLPEGAPEMEETLAQDMTSLTLPPMPSLVELIAPNCWMTMKVFVQSPITEMVIDYLVPWDGVLDYKIPDEPFYMSKLQSVHLTSADEHQLYDLLKRSPDLKKLTVIELSLWDLHPDEHLKVSVPCPLQMLHIRDVLIARGCSVPIRHVIKFCSPHARPAIMNVGGPASAEWITEE